MGTKTKTEVKLFTCPQCDGGLDGSDLNYGLVCPACCVRVAGPFATVHDVPEYKTFAGCSNRVWNRRRK